MASRNPAEAAAGDRSSGPSALLLSIFSRLPTGRKMFVLLSAALLPLGLIAILASLNSAQSNRAARDAAARLVAAEGAERLNLLDARTAATLRVAATVLGGASAQPERCRRTLDALAAAHRAPVRFALFAGDGRLICTMSGFKPPSPPPLALSEASRTDISPSGDALMLVVRAADGDALGVAEFPAAAVAALARPRRIAPGGYAAELRSATARLPLATMARPAGATITVSAPFSRARLRLFITMPGTPLSATELLVVILPVLMWIAAAAIGWLVVDRLVLRPLTQLQVAIAAYRAGDPHVAIPRLTTPAQEIRELGEAFRGVAQTVARHEAELEEGIARQTRLTREVHHRVKNNLQVVASLLNLHARGARSAETAAAYASIQRRVDALAIVHRNHYAELEDNRGVALRPLVAELAANLRGSIPDDQQPPAIVLDLKPFYVGQDVAVSVAFLVTELVEMALICAPGSRIEIGIAPTGEANRAELSVRSPALVAGACADDELARRFTRVIDGLSRQLRAPLARDDSRMAIAITVLAETGYGTAQANAAAPIAAMPTKS